MEKMTIKGNFEAVRAFLAEHEAPASMIEFVNGRIAQVEAKNAKRSTKPTKAQAENAILAEAVIANMQAGKAYTVTEIQKVVPELKEFSNQKASAIVRILVKEGRIIRTEAKGGKTLFSLV